MSSQPQQVFEDCQRELFNYASKRTKYYPAVWQYCDLSTIQDELSNLNPQFLQTIKQLEEKIAEHDSRNFVIKLWRRFIYPRNIEEQRSYLFYLKMLHDCQVTLKDPTKFTGQQQINNYTEMLDKINYRSSFKLLIKNLLRSLSELVKKNQGEAVMQQSNVVEVPGINEISQLIQKQLRNLESGVFTSIKGIDDFTNTQQVEFKSKYDFYKLMISKQEDKKKSFWEKYTGENTAVEAKFDSFVYQQKYDYKKAVIMKKLILILDKDKYSFKTRVSQYLKDSDDVAHIDVLLNDREYQAACHYAVKKMQKKYNGLRFKWLFESSIPVNWDEMEQEVIRKTKQEIKQELLNENQELVDQSFEEEAVNDLNNNNTSSNNEVNSHEKAIVLLTSPQPLPNDTNDNNTGKRIDMETFEWIELEMPEQLTITNLEELEEAYIKHCDPILDFTDKVINKLLDLKNEGASQSQIIEIGDIYSNKLSKYFRKVSLYYHPDIIVNNPNLKLMISEVNHYFTRLNELVAQNLNIMKKGGWKNNDIIIERMKHQSKTLVEIIELHKNGINRTKKELDQFIKDDEIESEQFRKNAEQSENEFQEKFKNLKDQLQREYKSWLQESQKQEAEEEENDNRLQTEKIKRSQERSEYREKALGYLADSLPFLVNSSERSLEVKINNGCNVNENIYNENYTYDLILKDALKSNESGQAQTQEDVVNDDYSIINQK